jgi:hypothetical protein
MTFSSTPSGFLLCHHYRVTVAQPKPTTRQPQLSASKIKGEPGVDYQPPLEDGEDFDDVNIDTRNDDQTPLGRLRARFYHHE